MTPEAAEKLETFFLAFAGCVEPLLLLDYDGTLAPFRVDRFKATPFAGVRKLLAKIQQQGRTRMVVVTGRPAAEIMPLLDLQEPLQIWGLHGSERLDPDGRQELEKLPDATRAKLAELKEHLRRDSLGGLFEDKANGAVMHWRGVSPREGRLIEERTRALFEPLARVEPFSLLEFEAGLELRVGRGKGGAVREILREAGPGATAAFMGDDVTDEAAFLAVNQSRGAHLSVLVRPEMRETVADCWLRPPKELRKFLEMWVRAFEGKRSQ